MRRTSSRRAALLLAVAMLALSVACGKAPTVSAPGKITIRYGPFTIPATTPTAMGMIENNIKLGIEKPCRDCYVTGLQAGLINTDGTDANVDDGLWLHHMVMVNSGAKDATCPGEGPGIAGERFFSSGNERTTTHDLSNSGYGYPVKGTDSWTLVYDLMNLTATAKPVYVTVTYDYVPLNTPGYKPMKPIWLDINPCRNSEMNPQEGKYSYSSMWMSTVSGKLLGLGAHVHDGGVNVVISKNGEPICDSRATYGGDPAYIEGAASVHMPGMPHIATMSTCAGTAAAPLTTIAIGDRLEIQANYDSDAHMQMGTEEIMGISIGYFDPS